MSIMRRVNDELVSDAIKSVVMGMPERHTVKRKYVRTQYANTSYEFIPINRKTGEPGNCLSKTDEPCFAGIMYQAPSNLGVQKPENYVFFLAFALHIKIKSIPYGEEYIRLVANTPLGRFLLYNVDEFINHEKPLLIRMTPNNVAWYGIIALIRHVREYECHARTVVRLVQKGVPLWFASMIASSYREDESTNLLMPSYSSHSTIRITIPIAKSKRFFGSSYYRQSEDSGIFSGLISRDCVIPSNSFIPFSIVGKKLNRAVKS